MTVDSSQHGGCRQPDPDAADPQQVATRGPEHPLRRERSAAGTPTAVADARPSLSPSRAADFKTCPLLYRLRSIDRLPETPSRDQARGTLVHAVLERLFELPAHERTPSAAAALVAPEWQRLQEMEPALTTLFPESESESASGSGPRAPGDSLDPPAAASTTPAAGADPTAGGATDQAGSGGPAPASVTDWLDSARRLLEGYFSVEDPRRLEPAERESLIEVVLDSGLRLRGFVDRLDVSPAGDLRVVDYKTGGAPREAFEARALFQLKFYALVLWRTRGVVPRSLRLLYLRDREACDYTPDAEELTRFERTLTALWAAIDRATRSGRFPAKPSRLCDWCAHQPLCPAFGGTPPPFPGPDAAEAAAASPPRGRGQDRPA